MRLRSVLTQGLGSKVKKRTRRDSCVLWRGRGGGGGEKRGIGGPTHYEGQSSDDELLKTNSDKFSTEIGNLALTPPTMVEYRCMWKCCTA